AAPAARLADEARRVRVRRRRAPCGPSTLPLARGPCVAELCAYPLSPATSRDPTRRWLLHRGLVRRFWMIDVELVDQLVVELIRKSANAGDHVCKLVRVDALECAAGVQDHPAVGLDREQRHAAHVRVVLEELAIEVVDAR